MHLLNYYTNSYISKRSPSNPICLAVSITTGVFMFLTIKQESDEFRSFNLTHVKPGYYLKDAFKWIIYLIPNIDIPCSAPSLDCCVYLFNLQTDSIAAIYLTANLIES